MKNWPLDPPGPGHNIPYILYHGHRTCTVPFMVAEQMSFEIFDFLAGKNAGLLEACEESLSPMTRF